jgi:hypothetical protein
LCTLGKYSTTWAMSFYLFLFCFWVRVSLMSLPRLILNMQSCFLLLSSWHYRCVPLHPALDQCFLKALLMGITWNSC